MTPDKREIFKVDARTVDVDPTTGQLVARGMNGRTRYSFWGLVSTTLYPGEANYDYLKEGILGLKVTMYGINSLFSRYTQRQIEEGHELELGVAVITSEEYEKGFKYLHKDLGIWERIKPTSIRPSSHRVERLPQMTLVEIGRLSSRRRQ